MRFKTKQLLTVSLLFCVIFLTFNSLILNSFAFEVDETGTVYNIVDGDTIDVSSVGRIRLADIDTPEQGEPGYDAASNYISSLIYQKNVYIDVDDVHGTDVYGRIVAVVYVYHDSSHLKNVNKALLDSGHAVIWNFDNEFNPYTWTLLVDYPPPSDPPPDDPPPVDPPPNDPPPNDPPSYDPPPPDIAPISQWVSIVGIGTVVSCSSIVIGAYAYNNLVSKRKKKFKLPLKPKNINHTAKPKFQIRKATITSRSMNSMKLVKDLKALDKHVNIRGTVKKINKVHNFTKKNGSIGKIGSFQLSDTTGTIKVILLEDKTSLLNFNNFKLGCSITIKNAFCRINNFHGKTELEILVSKNSQLRLN